MTAEQQAREMFVLVASEMDLADEIDTTASPIPNEILRRRFGDVKRTCQHVRLIPGPFYVHLAIDTICCDQCLSAALAYVKQVDATDQHCDICRKWVEDNQFSEFVTQVGPFVFFGNRGSCCRDLSWWRKHVALPVYNWLARWRAKQRGQFIHDEIQAWYQCPILTPHDPHGNCPGKTFPGRPV